MKAITILAATLLLGVEGPNPPLLVGERILVRMIDNEGTPQPVECARSSEDMARYLNLCKDAVKDSNPRVVRLKANLRFVTIPASAEGVVLKTKAVRVDGLDLPIIGFRPVAGPHKGLYLWTIPPFCGRVEKRGQPIAARTDAQKAFAPEPAPKQEPIGDPGTKIVLLALAITPSGPEGYIISGKLKNISDEQLERVNVDVSLEDRGGEFLGNAVASVSPRTIPPGGYAVIEGLSVGRSGVAHATLNFTTGGQAAIPWRDMSGRRAHP
jgi:hypothetical protein